MQPSAIEDVKSWFSCKPGCTSILTELCSLNKFRKVILVRLDRNAIIGGLLWGVFVVMNGPELLTFEALIKFVVSAVAGLLAVWFTVASALSYSKRDSPSKGEPVAKP